MKLGRERAVEDTDILRLKEVNTTQGLRDPYYSWQFDHILSHSSTTAFSLRSKRFRVSSSRKLGREQKGGMRGSGRGEKEKLARKAHDFDSKFCMTLKNSFGKCSLFVILFPWMKRSKHGLFVFWRKKTQSCCSMMSKRSID